MSRTIHPLRVVLAAVVLLGLMTAGCADDEPDASTDTTDTTSDATTSSTDSPLSGEITVSAAASLTDAFTQIGDDFTSANPDASVTFNFDSSGTLSQQIVDGAPADVLASADEANMTRLSDADLIDGEPAVFAQNELTIVVKPGNPQGIESLADLADAGIISLCVDTAPCGKYSAQILEAAGVSIAEDQVTRGQNASATLTAVSEGDADAGIVYVTDALAAGDAVQTVELAADQNAIASYPIAVIEATGDAEVAGAFVAWVLGDEGQAVLKEFGFLAP